MRGPQSLELVGDPDERRGVDEGRVDGIRFGRTRPALTDGAHASFGRLRNRDFAFATPRKRVVAHASFGRLRNRDFAVATPRKRVVTHASFGRLRNRDFAFATPRKRVVTHAKSSAVFTRACEAIASRTRRTASAIGTPFSCEPSRKRKDTVPAAWSCAPAMSCSGTF